MSTAVALRGQQCMPLAEIQGYADVFRKSGMFPDIKDVAQAVVKIQAGAELGLPPFRAMKSIHIINGQSVTSGNCIAAMVKSHPRYDYEIEEYSAKRCFGYFIDKTTGKRKPHEYTWSDAEAAGDASKPNYKKFPKAMLFNRWISSGYKVYAPDATNGIPLYTPDEMGASINEQGEMLEVEGEIVDEKPTLEAPKPDPSQHPQYIKFQDTLAELVAAGHCTEDEGKGKWRSLTKENNLPAHPAAVPAEKFDAMLTGFKLAVLAKPEATTDTTTNEGVAA